MDLIENIVEATLWLVTFLFGAFLLLFGYSQLPPKVADTLVGAVAIYVGLAILFREWPLTITSW